MRKRKAFYWTDAADWIADNDDPECLDVDTITGLTTVCLISDLTGVTQEEIAAHIVFLRESRKVVSRMPVQHLA